MLSFYPSKSHSFQNPKHFFPQLPENRVFKFCPELEHYLVPYPTSAVMALVWQMYRLLANLTNFSSCFSKFVLALFFSHVFEFLSQMKIPNLRDSVCQTKCFHFGKNGSRCLVSLAHNGSGVVGAKRPYLASTSCVKVFRSKFKAISFHCTGCKS